MSRESRSDIRILAPHSAPATLADDVRAGLGAYPKSLPPKYFYDELGSKLFEAITLLPEYYPTRAEREILARSAGDVVARAAGGEGEEIAELVEFGSGSAEKTRLLIEAILARQPRLRYVPIDISRAALEESASELLGAYPALEIRGYASDYEGAIEALAGGERSGRRLALFLGSNVGNFKRGRARDFLRAVRTTLAPGDALLLGADLRKDVRTLEAAYDDPTGVTAAFNLNVLGRINRELGADFDLREFRHCARYNERRGRVEMHLVSERAQRVEIRELRMTVDFREGETIHTENSHKYDVETLDEMARATGFERVETWFDAARRFSSSLLAAAAG